MHAHWAHSSDILHVHSTRATMPAAIGLYVDKVAGLQRRASEDASTGAQLQDVFEDTMRVSAEVGQRCIVLQSLVIPMSRSFSQHQHAQMQAWSTGPHRRRT